MAGKLGMRGAIAREQIPPRRVLRRATLADAVSEILIDAVRHEELRVLWPAVEPLREPHFVVAKRLAVRLRTVLLVRRTIADVALDDDQRRAATFARREIKGAQHLSLIVGVAHVQHVPTKPQEPGGNILGEGDLGVSLDRHAIGVVDPAQLVETEMPSEGRSLAGNPLHHAAVAA